MPSVLFVSVNPFSATSNNGKTFASFFKDYPSDKLAQLYFHRELPSSEICVHYGRITDEAVLASLPFPWRTRGEVVTPASNDFRRIPDRTHTALKQSNLVRLLRQVLWLLVPFRRQPLLTWLDAQRPEIIMFCGSDANYLYRKTLRLAKRYDSRIIYYITDDYILPTRSSDVWQKIIRAWTRHEFKRMARASEAILTIGKTMSDAYQREFGISAEPFMNLVDLPQALPRPRTKAASDNGIRILFAGSVHSGRSDVLAQLADSIVRLQTAGQRVQLDLFGPLPEHPGWQQVVRPPHVRYLGLASPKQLAAEIAEADILVHVESDDPKDMEVTALSVSTKIPEYLASGRPIFAIGPSVASINYLEETQSAVVVRPNAPLALDAALQQLVEDEPLRTELSRRGFELAQHNHDGDRQRSRLWKLFREVGAR